MKLEEAFKSQESKVELVAVFIDMVGSTAMKEKESEASWLTSLGWFFDTLSACILREEGGKIVKFLGDGMFVVYPANNATEAINAAIRIQEALHAAVKRKHVYVHCSIGIATGEVVRFTNGQGHEDYVGNVIDRASRLCSAASGLAIFIDESTAEYTHWPRVVSKIGHADDRTNKEYKGDLLNLKLKGFQHSVKYHQIFWHHQKYGVKPERLDESIQQEQNQQMHQELYQLGIRLFQDGDPQKSVETLQKAAELGSSTALDALFQIGEQYDELGHSDVANHLWQWAAQRNHRDSLAKLKPN